MISEERVALYEKACQFLENCLSLKRGGFNGIHFQPETSSKHSELFDKQLASFETKVQSGAGDVELIKLSRHFVLPIGSLLRERVDRLVVENIVHKLLTCFCNSVGSYYKVVNISNVPPWAHQFATLFAEEKLEAHCKSYIQNLLLKLGSQLTQHQINSVSLLLSILSSQKESFKVWVATIFGKLTCVPSCSTSFLFTSNLYICFINSYILLSTDLEAIPSVFIVKFLHVYRTLEAISTGILLQKSCALSYEISSIWSKISKLHDTIFGKKLFSKASNDTKFSIWVAVNNEKECNFSCEECEPFLSCVFNDYEKPIFYRRISSPFSNGNQKKLLTDWISCLVEDDQTQTINSFTISQLSHLSQQVCFLIDSFVALCIQRSDDESKWRRIIQIFAGIHDSMSLTTKIASKQFTEFFKKVASTDLDPFTTCSLLSCFSRLKENGISLDLIGLMYSSPPLMLCLSSCWKSISIFTLDLLTNQSTNATFSQIQTALEKLER